MFPMHSRMQDMYQLIQMHLLLNLLIQIPQHRLPLPLHHKILRPLRHMHLLLILLRHMHSRYPLPDMQLHCQPHPQPDHQTLRV